MVRRLVEYIASACKYFKIQPPNIDDTMLTPLLIMFISFFLFFISLVLLKIKGEIIIRKLEIIESSKT